MITPIPATSRFDTVPTTTSATVPTATTTSTQGSAQAGAQAAAQAGGAMGQDQFMQLLIAQLQNQDPTQPMDDSQMAAELAQFSSLTELTDINTTLTGQSTSDGTLLGAVQATSAISTLGHTVMASGNGVQLGGTDGATSVTADFGSAASSATLNIYDSTGNEVGSRSLGTVGAGRQTIDLGSAVNGLQDGAYTYSITGTDSTGAPVTVQTYTIGKVDGVQTGANGLVLTAGALTIPYANVVQIN